MPAVLNVQNWIVWLVSRFLVLSVTIPKESDIEQVSLSMTPTPYYPVIRHHRKFLKPALTLVLCGILAACSDSVETDLQSVSESANTPFSTNTSPDNPPVADTQVIAVGPSVSAAQLSNDSTVTVREALALVTEEAVSDTRPVGPPAAATPSLVDALTPTAESVTVDSQTTDSVPANNVTATDVPVTDTPATNIPNTDVPATDVPATDIPATDVPNTNIPAASVEEPLTSATDSDNTQDIAEVADISGESEITESSPVVGIGDSGDYGDNDVTQSIDVDDNDTQGIIVDNNATQSPAGENNAAENAVENTPATVVTEGNVDIDQGTDADLASSPSSSNGQNTNPEDGSEQRRFVSVTTPGFEGEVLDDAIRITWEVDPTARGYNVYKQADYYTTVFDNEFVDTDVYDDDYYYEIQAFTHDDVFNYIATGLTVKARSFGRIDPDAPVPNTSLLDDYELVFADEFNNTTLDLSKWNTSFLWGTDLFINSEEQYYVDVANDPDFGFNPFSFDGEHLTISTIETPPELSEKALGQPYLSGIITSYDAFKFTYGYAETRAKFTHGRGYWPAFWLLNAYYGDDDPEIDIMEFIGHNQDVIYHTYHYFDENGELRSTQSFPVPGIDYTADFHTFGVEWKPGLLVFYVDGIETMRIVDANVSSQQMYVIANQAVGGWWAGPPDETTPFPGEYVIDYIRVYQQITPLEIIQFDQTTDIIPLNIESPGLVLPNKRPPFWLWPNGYPEAP